MNKNWCQGEGNENVNNSGQAGADYAWSKIESCGGKQIGNDGFLNSKIVRSKGEKICNWSEHANNHCRRNANWYSDSLKNNLIDKRSQ